MKEKYTIDLNGKMYSVLLVPKDIKRVILKVDYTNQIRLHYPQSLPQKEALAHMYRQLGWLKRTTAKNEKNIKNMHVRDVIAGKKIWLLGNLYNIKNAAESNSYKIDENNIYISTSLSRVLTSIRKTLCKQIEEEFMKIRAVFTPFITQEPQVRFRKMRSRWGSCNHKTGVITLNSLLVHVPLSTIHYIIYHEFTHFIHPNHSKDFYKTLEKFYPNYKQEMIEIKKYSFLLRI